ncbi:stonustoxin subunit beta-like [Oreochromis aureus]|uniref:stonustoxin subunit beta-like n=1 Tax=Oreochromis aureus TaxID=47969 RepID=UPI001954AF9F|nr:stonustoxin subunit beta-like [Oreochromis aureus]
MLQEWTIQINTEVRSCNLQRKRKKKPKYGLLKSSQESLFYKENMAALLRFAKLHLNKPTRLLEPFPLGRVEPAGVQWLRPGGLRKYSCQLKINTNTVNRKLKLSDKNRKVTRVEELQSYPDHPDRFDYYHQLLCRNGLTGRCYWEVRCRGRVYISVSYRSIGRKGDSNDCVFGENNQSWSLSFCGGSVSARHNNKEILSFSSSSSSSSVSNKVAVYVDCPAGTLSFYKVSSDTLIHLHTFNTAFTETIYPGFGLWSGSSVSLC